MDFIFDIPAFRIAYPEFSNPDDFSDDLLQQNWNSAIAVISPRNFGVLNGDNRYLAITLMTAHITKIGTLIAAGKMPTIQTAGSVGAVSVTLLPPPGTNQFNWWLNTTAYGAQYLFILKANSIGAGGFIGGSPERSAFLGVGGVWPWPFL